MNPTLFKQLQYGTGNQFVFYQFVRSGFTVQDVKIVAIARTDHRVTIRLEPVSTEVMSPGQDRLATWTVGGTSFIALPIKYLGTFIGDSRLNRLSECSLYFFLLSSKKKYTIFTYFTDLTCDRKGSKAGNRVGFIFIIIWRLAGYLCTRNILHWLLHVSLVKQQTTE